MKNITKYLLVSLSLAFIVSSCGVQKRLHNPGFHVQLNKNYKSDKSSEDIVKVDKTVKTSASKSALATLPEVEQEVVNPKATMSSKELTSSNEVVVEYTENVSDMATNDESMSFHAAATSKRSFTQSNHSVVNQSVSQPVNVETQGLAVENTSTSGAGGGGASGATLVLLVILCLFPLINLIPVYITDGGITLNFWVTLLLNLTFIGAVIFSLLVVLGVVSLA